MWTRPTDRAPSPSQAEGRLYGPCGQDLDKCCALAHPLSTLGTLAPTSSPLLQRRFITKTTAPAPTASRIASSSQAIRLRNKPANCRGDSTRQSEKQQQGAHVSGIVESFHEVWISCGVCVVVRRGRWGTTTSPALGLVDASRVAFGSGPACERSDPVRFPFPPSPAKRCGNLAVSRPQAGRPWRSGGGSTPRFAADAGGGLRHGGAGGPNAPSWRQRADAGGSRGPRRSGLNAKRSMVFGGYGWARPGCGTG